MGSVPVALERGVRAAERVILGKRAQQLVMARSRLVDAGEDGVGDAKRRVRADAQGGEAVSGVHAATGACGRFEGADHGRSDGDHAASPLVGAAYRLRRRYGNAIRLVEGEPPIERRVARGGDARGVGDGRELDAALPQHR